MGNSGSRENRMRAYEIPWKLHIPAKKYTILRVDGRNFHTVTRNMSKPFDEPFMTGMDWVGQFLCEEIQGAQFAYIQSDEVSVLITGFGSYAEQWFGGSVAKMISISAATATMGWLGYMHHHPAVFDSRVFTVPDRHEAINYFLWRQADCHRNAISMAAEAHFPSKQLLHVKVPQRREMLEAAGIDYDQYPQGARLGRVVTKQSYPDTVTYTHRKTGEQHSADVTRTRWEVHPAPWFDWDEAGFLETHTPHREGVLDGFTHDRPASQTDTPEPPDHTESSG